MWAQFVNVCLGLVTMALPALLGFEKIAANNNYIAGPLVITFALVAITEAGRNVRLFAIPVGFWLMAGPLLLGFSTTARLADMLLGILVVLFSLFKGKVTQRFGGGWRSLWQKEPEHWKVAQRWKEEKRR